jgi:hypothetical protein
MGSCACLSIVDENSNVISLRGNTQDITEGKATNLTREDKQK